MSASLFLKHDLPQVLSWKKKKDLYLDKVNVTAANWWQLHFLCGLEVDAVGNVLWAGQGCEASGSATHLSLEIVSAIWAAITSSD